ncbi:MAG: hypothetical protein K6B14_07690 [Lachnospiraceae bacterium]|nr:hypothetical protein [Lachnospiraceae bacterium]
MYLFYLAMKTPNGILSIGILLYIIILAILCPIFVKKEKYAVIRMLCVLPAIVAAIHVGVSGTLLFRNNRYLYLEALLPLIYLLPGKSGKLTALKSVVSSLAVLTLCLCFLINSINLVAHDYTRYSYTEGFKKMLNTLSKEYCLSSWKKIDYDALMNDYLPEVMEAEKNNDEVAYAEILTEVTYRFYDEHVYAEFSDELEDSVCEELAGNDYGLSMIRLDDGSVIAVCVEPDTGRICDEPGIFGLNKLGIHDGTRILSWDGMEIDEAIENTEYIYPGIEFPVKSNEDMLRPLLLAGRGGDSIKVTFLDDDGAQKEAELKKHDSYSNRLAWAYRALLNRNIIKENFYSCMLDDECGYFLVLAEQYDDFLDMKAALRKGYYPELTEYYAGIIRDLEDQGMKRLVIDLRNNYGGSDYVAGALASLFTKEKLPLCSFGYEDEKGYHAVDNSYIFPTEGT